MGKPSHILLFCLIFSLLSVACKKSEEKTGFFGTGSSGSRVEGQEAAFRKTPDFLRVRGVFIPSRRVQIKSEFNGQVEELSVAKGQAVSTGNLLLRIEDERLPEELAELLADLQIAEAWLFANQSSALEEEPEEVLETAEEVGPAEEPTLWEETFRESGSAFAQLAAEIFFTPVDAGGVWPAVDPRRIAMADDSQDAGGIWPRYGEPEMVTGEGAPAPWEVSILALSPPARAASEPVRALPAAAPEAPLAEEAMAETSEATESPTATEVSETDARLALDQARVDRILAEIAILENELASRTLLSPIDGQVDKVVVSNDSRVEDGDFLVEIFQLDPIEFLFNVPKHQVEFLEPGMTLTGRLSEKPHPSFEGEISFIGAELNADQETVAVRARVDNPEGAFQEGMKGNAEIATSRP